MAQNQNTTALSLSMKLSVSESTIERDLTRLTDACFVEYAESSKDGEWKQVNHA
ncbi:MAG: hypothetical protein ACOX4A_06070 [Saccharofermentanales bacterium]